MKTLNEVIKAFECCENGEPYSNCKECSYIGIGSCCLERENDALHYLKEYRDKAHKLDIDIAEHHRTFEQLGIEIARYQKAKAEMEEISADYVALKQLWSEQQENPPLSWDELKQMEGKPVWMERKNSKLYHMWGLVARIKRYQGHEYVVIKCPDLCNSPMSNIRLYDTMYLNDGWQAYRKERK